eukprot:GILI01007475.1.p1 GENE.GILI01007475.1~~GILI01007475.1.p1  ORF type:complete len:399 (+),score=141.39 GILI01007475.1:48-1244(+)
MASEKDLPTRIPEVNENFLRAARSRDVAKCASMLTADPTIIDCIEAGGFSAMHFAAFNGDLELIKLLLQYKPNIELVNYDGNTPMMMAAKVRRFDAIKALVDAGASVNFQASGGATAAHFAASMGDVDTVRYLVSLGAKTIHEGNPTGTLLHWAAHSGSIKCVGAMIYEFKIPVDAPDAHGGTALFTAIFTKKSEVVQFLLEHGANPNAHIDGDLSTPLHIAAEHAEVEDVRYLLGFGADVNAVDKEGCTPIQCNLKLGEKANKTILKELSKTPKNAVTRAEDAARFKTHGNKVFAEGENVKAAKFYSQAIQNEPLNHVYFSNRAACQFNLREYDNAYLDASRCLVLSPKFVRGFFRKAAAQYALKDNEGAKKTIAEGLAIEAQNKDLLTLLEQINKN